MITLLYDGSFDGFLCGVSSAVKLGTMDIQLQCHESGQLALDEQCIEITTSETLSRKTYERMKKRWGNRFLEDCYTAFLYPNSETLLVHYVQLMIHTDSPPFQLLSHPKLMDLEKRITSVRREIHRFKGFIRFRELGDNLYYADYEPTYDITPLLLPHFVRRFPGQRMILHDCCRSYAGLYDTKQTIYTPMKVSDIPADPTCETAYQQLWQEYIHHLSIEERQNKNLQRNLMPKKYWRYLTEMKAKN